MYTIKYYAPRFYLCDMRFPIKWLEDGLAQVKTLMSKTESIDNFSPHYYLCKVCESLHVSNLTEVNFIDLVTNDIVLTMIGL